MSLAEFHGVTLAYDILHADNKLIQQFPIFHPKHLMWFQVIISCNQHYYSINYNFIFMIKG